MRCDNISIFLLSCPKTRLIQGKWTRPNNGQAVTGDTMLITGLYLLVFIIIVILVLASNKPDCFQVQRKITIYAPAGKVFDCLNDLQRWKS